MAGKTFVIQESFSLIGKVGAGPGWEVSKHSVRDSLRCPTVKGCGVRSGFGWRRGLGAESSFVRSEWGGWRRHRAKSQDWGKVVVTGCQEVHKTTESPSPGGSVQFAIIWRPSIAGHGGPGWDSGRLLGAVREGLRVTQKWRWEWVGREQGLKKGHASGWAGT